MQPSGRAADRTGHRLATSVDGIFAALANPTRRELLRLLRTEGAQPVQRLAAHFPMRRPSVSEHLQVLRDAGLVSGHPADPTRRVNCGRTAAPRSATGSGPWGCAPGS